MFRELLQRRQIPESLRPKHYDVLVVLGGNIRYKGGQYFSTTWEDGPEKSIGSFWRPKAAAKLVMQGRTHKLIFSTGATHSTPGSPSEAQVLLEEFHRAILTYDDLDNIHYEVEQDRNSFRTIENARRVTQMLKQKKYKRAKTIGILTSSYHLARSYEMFSYEFRRQGLDKKIVLVSAESVLIEAEKRRGERRILDESRRAYRTERLRTQIREQKQGISDFRANRYKDDIPPG